MTQDPEGTAEALSLLSLSDLFSEIDPSALDLAPLASEIAVVNLRRGDVLLKQGDSPDCMYAVIRGRLQVLVDGPEGEQRLVGELRAGETVGELGLLDGSPRMATVTAVRDSQLVRISAAGFERLVKSNSDSLNKIARSEAERMRTMGQRRSPIAAMRTIAVIGAGEGAAIERFTAALCAALGELGTVLHLTRSRFETLYRRPFEPDEGVGGWLSELEGTYRFVVYECDAGPTAWTMHALRQADRILTVCDPGDSPAPSAIEQGIFEEANRGRMGAVELVLLHGGDAREFSHTSRWLAPRAAAQHHHVRLQRPGDVDRVARLLAGRSIGLTLGGGGARGIAHIGVVRAIEEAGIPIDMICGVSTGAIIAALHAMGHGWQEMTRLTKRAVTRDMAPDFTLPIVALSSGRKFRRVLDSFFGTTMIEDLALNFFCTSCNLSTSEMVIHRTGSLADAVHASNTIPGVMPPFLSSGQMLIDGGVLNNQPGDVMKKLFGGSVIVTNVSPRRESTVDAAFTKMPSPWRVLRSRLNPFEETIKVPGIPATMMRTLMVASDRKSREVEQMADFYLRPPIDRFRMDDFARVDELVEVGYQYARDEIRAWKESGRMQAVPSR